MAQVKRYAIQTVETPEGTVVRGVYLDVVPTAEATSTPSPTPPPSPNPEWTTWGLNVATESIEEIGASDAPV